MYVPPVPQPEREPWRFATTTSLDHPVAVDELGERLGRLCLLVGLNPMLGRLYAVLYLSARAISLDELRETVGAAKSTVSVSIRKLLDSGVVQKHRRLEDRRDYYTAVADPAVVVQLWHQAFLARELAALGELTRGIRRELADPRGEAWPDPQECQVLRGRLDQAAAFATAAEGCFRAVTGE